MTVNTFPKKILILYERCLTCKYGGLAVLGEGPKKPELMLIGQNPGLEESRTGRPFIGRSGKFLDSVLDSVGLIRSELFITSIFKCRTPKNRPPTKEEIDSCVPLLLKQINEIKPKIIVLMGKAAWKCPVVRGIIYLKTYHPAAAMRFPKIRKRFLADLQNIRSVIDSIHREE